jgi:hypothetical protein
MEFEKENTMLAIKKLRYIMDKPTIRQEEIRMNILNSEIKSFFSKIAIDRRKIRHLKKELENQKVRVVKK